MDRWTIKELENTNDLRFAQLILAERRAKVCPYSPLGQKLAHVIGVLSDMEAEQAKKEKRA